MRSMSEPPPFHRRKPLLTKTTDPSLSDIINEEVTSKANKFDLYTVFSSPCCDLRCMAYINQLEIVKLRMSIHGDFKERRSTLMKIMSSFVEESCGIQVFLPKIKGIVVCTETLARIFKISTKLIRTLKSEVLCGYVRSVHGNEFVSKSHTATAPDKGRLLSWIRNHGQYHPRSGKTVINKSTSIRIIASQSGIRKVSRAQYLMRKVKKIVSRESGSLMTRCKVCSKIKVHMRRGKTTRSEGRRLMETHMSNVKVERDFVNSSFALSEIDPELLHVTIDDMSNQATKLPHQLDSRAKSIPDNVLLRADLSAAVMAKKDLKGSHITDMMLDVGNLYGGKGNSTCGFLISCLQRFAVFPSKLHIQMDGARCNKNKSLFSFLSYLVDKGIFTNIDVHYLPSGHSHAHADRFFASVRTVLDGNEFFTPGELISALNNMSGVRSVRMDRINFDFKSWTEKQIGREMDGCFESMFFRFEKKLDKVVLTHRPLGSAIHDSREIIMSKLQGSPGWLKRSNDSSEIDKLIEALEKDEAFPEETVKMWKLAKDRIITLPDQVSWASVLASLERRKSKRILPPIQLHSIDQNHLKTFMNVTKKKK